MIYPSESNLTPVITVKAFEAINADKEWQLDEVARCAQEPWYWLVNYVYTIRKDEMGESFVELVPPKEYLRMVADDWCRHTKYAISKSRQLMCTWLMIGLHTWLAQFKGHQRIVCQSKLENDADLEMIQRANFIWEHQPAWMKRISPAKYSFCKLSFGATKSLMMGVASGGHQVRSQNPNAYLGDEAAFMPEMGEAYTAALPCCKRITLLSSAYPGFFDDLVHDRIVQDAA